MGILLVSRNRLKVAGSSGLRRKATMTGSVVHAPATIPSLDWPFLHSTIYSPSPIIPLVLSCFSSRLFISLSSLPFYRFSSISFAISFALRVAVNGNLFNEVSFLREKLVSRSSSRNILFRMTILLEGFNLRFVCILFFFLFLSLLFLFLIHWWIDRNQLGEEKGISNVNYAFCVTLRRYIGWNWYGGL